MKDLQKSFMAIFIAVLMISMNSCDSKDVDILPSMKATVDGEAWTSLFRLSKVTEDATQPNIVITGTPTASETADKTIILTTFGIEAGTYTFGTTAFLTECTVAYKKTADAADGEDNYYVAYDATIVITKIDKENKKLSGTFKASLRSTGNLADEIIISNGTFENLNYQ